MLDNGDVLEITTPLTDETVENLKAGQRVLISGTIYGGRDSAHKRMIAALDAKEPLPVDLKGQVIYYVGPAPAPPGRPIGSAGPTTSGRMDAYTPRLLEIGLKGMLGKGSRSKEVKDAIRRYKAVYLALVGGAAALISQSILESEVVAYEELGPEALRRMKVKNLPAVVINDVHGGDLYEQGRAKYAKGGDRG
ncbi:MAG: Fe-S-containing hydro-lyase [Deltaproteobacteria bacterium]|nr:Fe-S-containing hydro-lyase [Deltaproteobacteria bacterium]